MAKNTKTNAMRQIEKFDIDYEEIEYDLEGEFKSATDVAQQTHLDPAHMLKTLATISKAKNINIYVIPANESLDMKKCAKVAGEKSISILPTKDLKNKVGYQRGETTALAMKKDFPVFIEKSVEDYEYIVVSGGKKGISIRLNPKDFAKASKGVFEDLIQ
ncbi:MAG: YbaK/EbsC family protein [Anaerococcus sp.]|jgi:Cys-tRNA(Pro)/Cys-tRNA(Cys) deacylase|nr:YbaK/EbsC family protein [Peptoniphilaceae bacterium]MDY3054939.1 YbaK/EbsC family protein [Anaerococcus sp.]